MNQAWPCAQAPTEAPLGTATIPGSGGDDELTPLLRVLLSRDGEAFFYTSEFFYFYPPPGNFSLEPIFPGGGPVGLPTFVTIRGSGFLGFDGTAAHVRCRWSRLAPTPPEWPLGYAPSHGGAPPSGCRSTAGAAQRIQANAFKKADSINRRFPSLCRWNKFQEHTESFKAWREPSLRTFQDLKCVHF